MQQLYSCCSGLEFVGIAYDYAERIKGGPRHLPRVLRPHAQARRHGRVGVSFYSFGRIALTEKGVPRKRVRDPFRFTVRLTLRIVLEGLRAW